MGRNKLHDLLWVVVILIGICLFGNVSHLLAETKKPIKLKYAHWGPPKAVTTYGMIEPWIKEVEKRSAGRLKITLFAAAALGKPQDHYNLCVKGMADISLIEPSWTPGVFPLSEVITLPMLFPSSQVASAVFYELLDKYMRGTEYKEVKVLSTVTTPPAQINMVKKQVKKRNDLSGRKIIVTSPGGIATMRKLGAIPVFLPMPEIYTALERKVADGYCQNHEALVSFKTFEVTKARTEVSLWTDKLVTVMNKKSWNRLPKDLQDLLIQTTGLEQSKTFGKIFDGAAQELAKNVITPYDQKKGNPGFYKLPKDEIVMWKEAVAPLYEEWIKQHESKGFPARALFNDLMRFAEKHSK